MKYLKNFNEKFMDWFKDDTNLTPENFKYLIDRIKLSFDDSYLKYYNDSQKGILYHYTYVDGDVDEDVLDISMRADTIYINEKLAFSSKAFWMQYDNELAELCKELFDFFESQITPETEEVYSNIHPNHPQEEDVEEDEEEDELEEEEIDESMRFLKRFGFGKKEPVNIASEEEVFNVDTFNEWFNDDNNGAIYANKGIFLRTDKLSESQILDYILKRWGKDTYDVYSKDNKHYLIYAFYTQISYNWRQKLRE